MQIIFFHIPLFGCFISYGRPEKYLDELTVGYLLLIKFAFLFLVNLVENGMPAAADRNKFAVG